MSDNYLSLEHRIRLIHEGIIHKGDKFAPKGDTAIFRSGPGTNVGDTVVSNTRALGRSSNARQKANKPNVAEEMSDIGNVSAQQNVSYSESGKKKKPFKEDIATTATKGAAKFGSKFVPGLGQTVSAADAAVRYASGDKTGAAISALGVIPVAGSILGPIGDVVNFGRDITGMSSQSSKNNGGSMPPQVSADTPKLAPLPNAKTSFSRKKSRKPMKEDSTVPNEGNAPSVASLSAAGAPQEESGKKKKLKEESGTADRRTIENVARPNSAKSPFDRKSKLAKNSEIKQKIIDENVRRINTVKEAIEYKKQQDIEEGIGDILKSIAKTADNVVGKVGAGANWAGKKISSLLGGSYYNNMPIVNEPDESDDSDKDTNKQTPKKPSTPPGVAKKIPFAPGKKPVSEAAPDNAERIHTIKGVIGNAKNSKNTPTPVEFNPNMKKPDPNSTAS